MSERRNPLLVLALAACCMQCQSGHSEETYADRVSRIQEQAVVDAHGAASVWDGEEIAQSMELRNAQYTATLERRMRLRLEAWHARVSKEIAALYTEATGNVDDGSLTDVAMLKAIRAKVTPRTQKPTEPPAVNGSWTNGNYVWTGERGTTPSEASGMSGTPTPRLRPVGSRGLWADGVPYDSDVSRKIQAWEREAYEQLRAK
jgi:hypothetical protein